MIVLLLEENGVCGGSGLTAERGSMRTIWRIFLTLILIIVVADNVAWILDVPLACSDFNELEVDPENLWNNTVGSHPTEEDPYALENVWSNGQRRSRPQMQTKRPYHVLVIGCSYTFGVGLNDEDTYVWHLNELMPSVEFDNGAVGGYGTMQCLNRLRRQMKVKQYDCVIYGAIDDHLKRDACPKFRELRREAGEHDPLDNCYSIFRLPCAQLTSNFDFVEYKLHCYTFPFAHLSPLLNLAASYYGVYDVLHMQAPTESEQRMIFASRVCRMAQVAAAYGSKFMLLSLDDVRYSECEEIYSPLVHCFDNRYYKDIETPDRVRKMNNNHPGAVVNEYWAQKLAHYLSRPDVFAELINFRASSDLPQHRTLFDLDKQPVTWPW